MLIQFWQLLLSYLCVCESCVSSLNVCYPWINLAIFLLLFSFASVFLLFLIYYFSSSSSSSSSSSTVAAIFSLSISFGFAFVHLFSVHCSRFGLREFSIEFDILKFLPIPLRHRYCLDYMSSNNTNKNKIRERECEGEGIKEKQLLHAVFFSSVLPTRYARSDNFTTDCISLFVIINRPLHVLFPLVS